jgi:hypothetical protein
MIRAHPIRGIKSIKKIMVKTITADVRPLDPKKIKSPRSLINSEGFYY